VLLAGARDLEPAVCAHLALGQLRLDGWPCLGLSSIRKQVHDDSTLANGLVHLEQVCSRDPAVLHSFLPRRAVLSHTDDDIEAVIAEIETLTVTLRAITDQSEGVILKIFLSNLSIGALVRRGSCELRLTRSFSLGQSSLSNTCSLCPAKSTVLTPRVCCTGPAKAVLNAAIAVGLVARAELNVRFWRGWVGSFCFAAVRRVRASVFEAILKVFERYGTSERRLFLVVSQTKRISAPSSLAGPSSAARYCHASVRSRRRGLGVEILHNATCLMDKSVSFLKGGSLAFFISSLSKHIRTTPNPKCQPSTSSS
jgi:hypothetical protein